MQFPKSLRVLSSIAAQPLFKAYPSNGPGRVFDKTQVVEDPKSCP